MTLLEFLQLPHRFRWGGKDGIDDDCLTFLASYIAAMIGVDPAADLRGTYRTEDQAHEIVTEYGGMVPFVAAKVEPDLAYRVGTPETGDIAIIRAPAGFEGNIKEIGAICFGPIWATLGPGGVVGKKAVCVAAWRLLP